MKYKIVLILFLLLPALARADVLCSYNGADASNDSIVLESFIVTGPAAIVGDTVAVELKIRIYGQSNITLGSKGIFIAAKDPSNKDASFGFIYQKNITTPGQVLTLKAYRSLGKAGEWQFWPSYTAIVSKKEKQGPVWHVCKVNVTNIKDFDRDSIPDSYDNCPYKYNLDQNDSNANGIGDICEKNTTDLIVPLKQYSLPCSLSGKIYNFSYNASSLRIKFCEAQLLRTEAGDAMTRCKSNGTMWYYNVATDMNISRYQKAFEIMNNAPLDPGITVNISDWWKNLENEIDVDPLTGFLRYFWLDDNWTVCSGEPGSGRPTYNYLYPSRIFTEILPQVRYSNSSTTLSELKRLQTDTYNLSAYNITGNYIFQFASHIWRIRSDGSLIEGWPAWLSLPIDGYLDDQVSPGYIQPIAATQKLKECFSDFELPSTVYVSRDPKKCNVRKNITADDLIQACLEDRLQGGFENGYFKILNATNNTKTKTISTLKYTALISCNDSYLMQPMCRGSCGWQGTWTPKKSNFIVMNGSNKIDYDFIFVPIIPKEKNILYDFWLSIINFFQSLTPKSSTK